MMMRVLGNILCDLTQGQGQILNFLVNASFPKPFDAATSNLVVE